LRGASTEREREREREEHGAERRRSILWAANSLKHDSSLNFLNENAREPPREKVFMKKAAANFDAALLETISRRAQTIKIILRFALTGKEPELRILLYFL
jgi:hypothetical protein